MFGTSNLSIAPTSCAECSIVEASRLFYARPSFEALDDPRVALHIADGRNYLLVQSERFDLITIDVSFISLRLVLPALIAFLAPAGHLIALVKPLAR